MLEYKCDNCHKTLLPVQVCFLILNRTNNKGTKTKPIYQRVRVVRHLCHECTDTLGYFYKPEKGT